MKISILQQDLLPVLQSVSRSCGVKAALPILANILIQTDSNTLKLSGTNLELGVIKSVPAEIMEEGDITVPARTLLEIVSTLPNTKIELESSGDQLKLTSAHFNATLNGITATEFPSIPVGLGNSFVISAQMLKDSLPQIAFAAAADEGRPILTGILTEIKDNKLELVATDGFRLAHKATEFTNPNQSDSLRLLIPRKTFEEVIRLISEELDSENQQVEISTSENQNQIIFKVGGTTLSSRLIEGQYPAWERIVPTKQVGKVIVDRSELLKGVKLASVFAKGDSANIIKMQTLPNRVVLTSEAKELGGQQSEVDAQGEGEELLVAFNSKYLTEALSATKAEQVEFLFSGNLSPALMKPVGEPGLEYVIMPVRLT